MSQQPPSQQGPSDSADAGGWDAAAGQKLDEAMARAADLAAELSEELGRPENTDPPEPRDLLTESGADLDAQLADLGKLVNATVAEVSDPTARPDAADRASASSVPNFMAEFTQPPPAKSTPSTDTIGSDLMDGPDDDAGSAATSVSSSGSGVGVGVVGGRIDSPNLGRTGPRPTSVGSATETASPKPTVTAAATNDADATNGRSRLGTIVVPVIGVLEALDRPFAWVGKRPRRAAGWAAILLLLVSAALPFLLAG